ncbi:MAG: sulfotransferase domain-containing protein [Candidatus Accumulibacter sp.]|jgi:hypothetical protein|nr:sulfotransferase domain-containing protein [Accumulibacter sp.]
MKEIAIFGVPRSGTSWLAQIFNSHPDILLRFQPLFSYTHKGRLTSKSSATEIHAFYEEIQNTMDEFASMRTGYFKNFPVFKKSPQKTHIVFKETRYLHVIENMLKKCADIRIIGIVRNPFSVLASWIQAPKEFKAEWNIEKEWQKATKKNKGREEEFFGFNRWKEVACNFLQYEQEYSRSFFLLRYETLRKFPLETTRELFRFSGLNIHIQTLDFLNKSTARHDLSDPYSVFRGKANDDAWQQILPESISRQIISELSGTPMDVFLSPAQATL